MILVIKNEEFLETAIIKYLHLKTSLRVLCGLIVFWIDVSDLSGRELDRWRIDRDE